MNIEFSGQYEKDGYFKAVAMVHRPSMRAIIVRIVFFLLFLGIYGVSLYGIFINSDGSISKTLISGRHFVTLLLFGYFAIQPFLAPRIFASRLWKDPIVRRVISGQITSQGIIVSPSEDVLRWDDFIKIRKTNETLILVSVKNVFLLLPQNFFKTEKEWQMAKDIVFSKVKEAI